jgi:hypothetical protein
MNGPGIRCRAVPQPGTGPPLPDDASAGPHRGGSALRQRGTPGQADRRVRRLLLERDPEAVQIYSEAQAQMLPEDPLAEGACEWPGGAVRVETAVLQIPESEPLLAWRTWSIRGSRLVAPFQITQKSWKLPGIEWERGSNVCAALISSGPPSPRTGLPGRIASRQPPQSRPRCPARGAGPLRRRRHSRRSMAEDGTWRASPRDTSAPCWSRSGQRSSGATA